MEDAEQSIRGAGQSPVILQGEDHAQLLRAGQALFDAGDAPVEGLCVGVAGQGRFLASLRHQLAEGTGGTPAPGVEPDAGDAQVGRQLEATQRVVHGLLSLRRIRRHEVLMDGEVYQAHPVDQGMAFETVEVGLLLPIHLPVKHVYPRHPPPTGLFDHPLDGRFSCGSANRNRSTQPETDQRCDSVVPDGLGSPREAGRQVGGLRLNEKFSPVHSQVLAVDLFRHHDHHLGFRRLRLRVRPRRGGRP